MDCEFRGEEMFFIFVNCVFFGLLGIGKIIVVKLYVKIFSDFGIFLKGEVVVKNLIDFIDWYIGGFENNIKDVL